MDFIKRTGNIRIEEDRIVCYVDNGNLKKKSIYCLNFDGVPTYQNDFKKKFDKYKINKPIYYLIENMEFETSTIITSYFDAHVWFKNCIFHKNIGITHGEHMIFENNQYFDEYPIYHYGKQFFYGKVGELKFIHDNFVNGITSRSKFGMNLIVDTLEVYDSKIQIGDLEEINIQAKKITIIDSNIYAPQIYIDSDYINIENSNVCTESIMIDNKERNNIDCISAPTIIYNNVDLNQNKYELKESRQKLIYQLRLICDYCNQLNSRKLKKIEDDLKTKPIQKILKN